MNEYFCEVNLTWKYVYAAVLDSTGLPEVEVVTQQQFIEDKRNSWTPEHLLAGAVSYYLMTTFLTQSEKEHIKIISYKSNSLLKLENKLGILEATEILLRPTIQLSDDQTLTKAIEIMDQTEKICPINNIFKLIIAIHPKFEI